MVGATVCILCTSLLFTSLLDSFLGVFDLIVFSFWFSFDLIISSVIYPSFQISL